MSGDDRLSKTVVSGFWHAPNCVARLFAVESWDTASIHPTSSCSIRQGNGWPTGSVGSPASRSSTFDPLWCTTRIRSRSRCRTSPGLMDGPANSCTRTRSRPLLYGALCPSAPVAGLHGGDRAPLHRAVGAADQDRRARGMPDGSGDGDLSLVHGLGSERPLDRPG